MSDQRDDERPRSARPAVPPFRGPRDGANPARPADKGTATSPAAPRPFIPGVAGAAVQRPLTPPEPPAAEPAVHLEPPMEQAPSTAAARDENGDQRESIAPPVETPPAAPSVEAPTSPELVIWTPPVEAPPLEPVQTHVAAPVAEDSGIAPERNEPAPVRPPTPEDQRLPALRFTGSSAFSAVTGAIDAADVDASVDDAFSALDGSPPRAPAQPPPASIPAPTSRLEEAIIMPDAPSTPPRENVEIPWLDTGADVPSPTPQQAATAIPVQDAGVPLGENVREEVARILEQAAARVRRGELATPAVQGGAGEEAILAALLAAMLGSRG